MRDERRFVFYPILLDEVWNMVMLAFVSGITLVMTVMAGTAALALGSEYYTVTGIAAFGFVGSSWCIWNQWATIKRETVFDGEDAFRQ